MALGAAVVTLWIALVACGSSLPSGRRSCSPGARTLASPGSRLWPETGNGGYRSLHTDVHLIYRARDNTFLAGTHVVITDEATHCLTSFSLDFERHSADRQAGPALAVQAVKVDGRRTRYGFVQPTYPGDPRGPNDRDPRAHEASLSAPVRGPHHNPLPPACTPEIVGDEADNSQNGQPCPADKLVIVPGAPIPRASRFTVTVYYKGHPGVHDDADGQQEGWFRAPDGGIAVSEPVGSEDWMPLNDFPAAKPAYDFYETVASGEVVLANGKLVSVTRDRADGAFPHGSRTWHWRSGAPVASYLVQTTIGLYRWAAHAGRDGIRYYEAQDAGISLRQQRINQAIIKQQEKITDWESRFTGRFPFSSDGVLVGIPDMDAAPEEMQTMVAFDGSNIDLSTLYHENMHQWWGDNVTESSYAMTFFKEGVAQMSEDLFAAANAARQAAREPHPRGAAVTAFERSLINTFDQTYRERGGFWTVAPSNPSPDGLFDDAPTYDRPAAAYIALRQILGPRRFTRVLEQIQQSYGGRTISEPDLKRAFAAQLPDPRSACRTRLARFFTQWFDTAYLRRPLRRPTITGPGLAGGGFYDRACPRPA
jgi:hypothetical protein